MNPESAGLTLCHACHQPIAADITVTRNDDATLTLNWTDDQPSVTLISRELFEQMVKQFNHITHAIQAQRDGIPITLEDSDQP